MRVYVDCVLCVYVLFPCLFFVIVFAVCCCFILSSFVIVVLRFACYCVMPVCWRCALHVDLCNVLFCILFARAIVLRFSCVFVSVFCLRLLVCTV